MRVILRVACLAVLVALLVASVVVSVGRNTQGGDAAHTASAESPVDNTESEGGPLYENARSRSLQGHQHQHGSDSHSHGDLLEDFRAGVEEDFDQQLRGGDLAYRNLTRKLAWDAARGRAANFEVTAVVPDERRLFDEFSIDPDDIFHRAVSTEMTRVRQPLNVAEDENGQRIEMPAGEPERTQISVERQLRDGQMPTKLFDLAMLNAQSSLVDSKLVEIFAEKHDLVPPRSSFEASQEWLDEHTLKIEVHVADPAWDVGATSAVINVPEDIRQDNPSAIQETIDRMIGGRYNEILLQEAANRSEEFATHEERDEYFDAVGQGVVTKMELVRFLRSHAKVDKHIPEEMRNDVFLQQREQSKYAPGANQVVVAVVYCKT